MPPSAKRRKTSASEAADLAESSDFSGFSDSDDPNSSNNSSNSSDAVEVRKVEESPYPGFDGWDSDPELKQASIDMPTFVPAQDRFVQSIKICHADAFKLKPLTIADGPLKGVHVIMLDPVKDSFRFMDLPPEIRNIIYIMMFEEPKGIAMATFKTKHKGQRAVRGGFRWNSKDHRGMKWNPETSKWDGQKPSAHALLRVCKRINTEAASVAYGDSQFSFNGLPELRTFLEDIGSMRQCLRHISFTGSDYHSTLATPAFHKLKDAKSLRSLTFYHATVCQEREHSRWERKTVALDKLVADLKPLIRALHKAQKSSDHPINVLDILKVGCKLRMDLCQDEKEGRQCVHRPAPFPNCDTRCSEWEKHVEETEGLLRKKVADALGLQETS